VHHGTAAVYARFVRAGPRYAQLRLADPVVAARGDHVVLRDETTVGGGRVLDPAPPRHADPGRMEQLDRGELAATIHAPVRAAELRHVAGGDLAGVDHAGEWLFSRAWLDELRRDLGERLADADPLDPGIPPPSEPWSEAIVPLLGLERRGAKLYRPGAAPELGERSAEAGELEARLGLDPIRVEDHRLARYLEEA